jgi:DNA-binding SARP family transcriptional activator
VTELPQGKAASLFKLLVLQRHRPLSRARLCSLYWPEADATSARNNLNVTLHRVRRLLGKAAQIVFRDESYQLQVAGEIWVDAEQFERLAEHGGHEEGRIRLDAAIEAYEAAAQLYQADLVPEIGADAALSPLAQALRDRLNQVLTRAATLRETSGDAHGCLQLALRCLALDACNEAAHRQLMRCYARLDQPLEVERQYRRCVSALRLQLGLGPSAETTAQYRRLAERQAA